MTFDYAQHSSQGLYTSFNKDGKQSDLHKTRSPREWNRNLNVENPRPLRQMTAKCEQIAKPIIIKFLLVLPARHQVSNIIPRKQSHLSMGSVEDSRSLLSGLLSWNPGLPKQFCVQLSWNPVILPFCLRGITGKCSLIAKAGIFFETYKSGFFRFLNY